MKSSVVSIRPLLVTLLVGAAAGCAPANVRVFEPVAHHTLRAGADTDQDVVWVQQYDSSSTRTKLVRCHHEQSGPKCVTAAE